MTLINVGINRLLPRKRGAKRRIEHKNVRVELETPFDAPLFGATVRRLVAIKYPGWVITGYAEHGTPHQELSDGQSAQFASNRNSSTLGLTHGQRDALDAEAARKILELIEDKKRFIATLQSISNSVAIVVASKACPKKMRPGLEAIIAECRSAIQ